MKGFKKFICAVTIAALVFGGSERAWGNNQAYSATIAAVMADTPECQEGAALPCINSLFKLAIDNSALYSAMMGLGKSLPSVIKDLIVVLGTVVITQPTTSESGSGSITSWDVPEGGTKRTPNPT